MQRGAAHELDVEVALAERALRGLADGGERLGQQVVERLAVLVALPELVGLGRSSASVSGDEVLFDRLTCSAILANRRRIRPSPARRTRSKMPTGSS